MCETKSLKKHRKNWCSFHHFVRLLKITIYLFNQGVKFEVEPLCNRRHFNETKTFQYRNWIWLLKCSHFILFTWTKRCFMNRSELRWKKREGFSPHWFRHSIEIKQTSPWNGLNEIHAYDLRRVLESNSLTVQFIWFKYSSRCLNWFRVVLHHRVNNNNKTATTIKRIRDMNGGASNKCLDGRQTCTHSTRPNRSSFVGIWITNYREPDGNGKVC